MSFDSSLQNVFSVNFSESPINWKTIEQKVPYLTNRPGINGAIYKNYLLFLGSKGYLDNEILYCWNLGRYISDFILIPSKKLILGQRLIFRSQKIPRKVI